MLPEYRRQGILKYVNENKNAKIEELSQLFNASYNTIRRDLDILAKQGSAIRTHGGIVANYPNATMLDRPYIERAQEHLSEKQLIGEMAAGLIANDETISLDYGTTVLEITKRIHHVRNLTVLTSSLSVSNELLPFSDRISVCLSGGTINDKINGLCGPTAESFYNQVFADKAFISVSGIDLNRGLMSSNWFEINIKEKMMKNCNEVILLLPHYRLDSQGLVIFSPWEVVHKVITNRPLPMHYQESFNKHNIEVISPSVKD